MYNDLNKYSALIVEDEEQVLRQMQIAIEDFIDKVFVAKNGEEAVEILQNNKINILITDILMPKMGGLDLIRHVRDNNIPVDSIIVTSAHSETNYMLDAIRLRVDGYLLKPINTKEMLELIQKTIIVRQKDEEIRVKDKLIDAISTFVGGKKIEIIRYLFANANEENIFNGSYEDIMADLNISKPTVVSTFRQLMDVGLIKKLKNTVYQINISN
ncbi:MAG TPA: response regulator [Campylobacterales bacterium]|nr:response regulator [Campylobacterales bacterium]